ncbi:DEAD/DEAH box helicase [Mesorhizobium sp. M0767]|uniref:DEAD/DEAH box helicase n=1 Tax=Mesorhizobium sp. M0767 TaxID=2956995 RepID=UPI003334D28B
MIFAQGSDPMPDALHDSPAADYQALVRSLPAGWQISERIVDPVIILSREGDRFTAMLAGSRTVGGRTDVWKALSSGHNWVADHQTVRPLPHDVPKIFRQMLEDGDPKDLSFPEVIRLIRLKKPDILVLASDSVFLSANESAQQLDAPTDILGLNASLFPYQAHGVAWMLRTLRHTGGLILADEMGLGKTIQIISLLLTEKPNTNSPALIICPTSLIANWRKEIFRFAPGLSVLIHRGSSRTGVSRGLQQAQIVLATYDTVVNDLTIFNGLTWSWLICDEAQALKNPDSNRRQAISSLPRRLTIPMTGLPVETSLLDLWSLADLAIPGLFGSRKSFETDFPDTQDSARRLARLTDPVILRRKVRDVAGDLPERIDIDVPLDLGDRLSERYDQVLQEVLERYPMAGALVATGQLQLFCAHPWLQGASGTDESDDAPIVKSPDLPLITPKVERTISILEQAFEAGKKVLIFALFNRCGDIVRQAAQGLPTAFWGAINGSTPEQDRQSIIDAFTCYDGPGCLVLNPKAAGAGLNITAATIVIHFTQAWNPALEAQASARAHRRGQIEPVYVYRLFYEDTVERVMIDRSEWRKELGNEALPVSTRDKDDLRRVLTLRPKRDE